MIKGSDLVSYNYDDTEALRLSGSFTGALSLFLAFVGGYFSGQAGWWWVGFVVLINFKMLYTYMGAAVNGKIEFYDQLLRLGACLIITGIFLLFFWLGYKVSPWGWWWLGLVLSVGVYTGLFKIINKPFFK
jgi:hypothetical protein